MIILDAATKNLQVILAGAITTSQLPVVASFIDILTSDQSVSTFSESDSTTNSTTAVVLVAAPAAGHTRTVKALSVHNADTASATATIRYNDGGTFRTIFKVLLSVGDHLFYESDGTGFYVCDNTGALKTAGTGGGGGGSVTTTGAPGAGNLTMFSGATSITNGDLSGAVTTTGTLVTTLTPNFAQAFLLMGA